MIRERNAIAGQFYVCDLDRPWWDRRLLKEIGMADIQIDMNIGRRLYSEKKRDEERYQTPMFMISAIKKQTPFSGKWRRS